MYTSGTVQLLPNKCKLHTKKILLIAFVIKDRLVICKLHHANPLLQ